MHRQLLQNVLHVHYDEYFGNYTSSTENEQMLVSKMRLFNPIQKSSSVDDNCTIQSLVNCINHANTSGGEVVTCGWEKNDANLN